MYTYIQAYDMHAYIHVYIVGAVEDEHGSWGSSAARAPLADVLRPGPPAGGCTPRVHAICVQRESERERERERGREREREREPPTVDSSRRR